MWSNAGTRSLWRDMNRLQQEMNRLLGTLPRNGSSARAGFPALNLWANQEHAMLVAELPGVTVDDLDISVVNDTVTLSGRRRLPESDGEAKWHRRERWHGEFSRTLQLPFRVDAEQVDASFQDGVLEVILPRAPEDMPRRITVKVATGNNNRSNGHSG